jgi:hypothetical protein
VLPGAEGVWVTMTEAVWRPDREAVAGERHASLQSYLTYCSVALGPRAPSPRAGRTGTIPAPTSSRELGILPGAARYSWLQGAARCRAAHPEPGKVWSEAGWAMV